jgi:hypothetical protein
MNTDTRIKAEEARRLKSDPAFISFVKQVRGDQLTIFADSGADEYDARENAHSIIIALNHINHALDAAILAERMLDRKKKG